MDITLRQSIADVIRNSPKASLVVQSINIGADGLGTITYNPANVWIDPTAPGFVGSTCPISDEEIVRAHLLLRLVTTYGYPASQETLEIERVYKPVGRPTGKGGRIDTMVRRPSQSDQQHDAFLFIECKAPRKYDEDLRSIDGQLFRLSKQEAVRPRFLVYYTVEFRGGDLRERIILIDTEAFPSYESWDSAGQPITDALPKRYGLPQKRRYANVRRDSEGTRSLDREATPETFHRLRTEIHDVIWGGGGTNNNEVFVIITRLLLCKIFDENETPPGKPYRFQRLGDALSPEPSLQLVERMNALYKEAEAGYLALTTPSAEPAFDLSRIAPEKIAYVVGRLEAISVTENKHPGDLLGEFFEQIVAQDFTQTKGQFFTPVKLIRFMLYLARAAEQAYDVLLHKRDYLGRPRLPYVIDPACGAGTFLIEYMKLIRPQLSSSSVEQNLPNRIREVHSVWFAGAGNIWAREFLFGIENNYDLGLAAKVNMVLHGDGSMNTWIKSGVLPFKEYWIEGRNNLLGISQPDTKHPYAGERNEQFDFILSNPPFSIKLSPDEKNKITRSFDVMANAQSEAIFIERWYQLLRDEGRFCCILPEAILDTSTFAFMRAFMIRVFKIEAVVSLPYDSFRPFTSTKTCIVLATKRTVDEVNHFDSAMKRQSDNHPKATQHEHFQVVLEEIGWSDAPIFMAEPASVGYKRRKNLSDLPQPNQLYQENAVGELANIDQNNPTTILDFYNAGPNHFPDSQLGFWTPLKNIAKRSGMRLDPKYRWLWDFQQGVAFGDRTRAVPLSRIIELVDLQNVAKGELDREKLLLDLEAVESRQALVDDELPRVDSIGSDKLRLKGCDLLFSKLEPYLGKVVIRPNGDCVGSTEWVGLKVVGDMSAEIVAYCLMLPAMCEAYRRLQSGKRHARLDPRELLTLKVELPNGTSLPRLLSAIAETREVITDNRRKENEIRNDLDSLFETLISSNSSETAR